MESGSSSEADKHKELGNKCYAAKDYNEAINHYTRGLMVDKNNHILYSNRSACHFSLKDFEKAADDAKQCIKLNPAFLKGYYRLAQALMEQEDWDGAYSTVRQGLSLDGDNVQLTKQLRTIRQQKKKAEAKVRQTEALMDARSRVGGENADEIRDLQEQYVNTNRELQLVNTNIQKEQREQKINDITMQEINMLPGDSEQRVFRGLGKMFILSNKGEVMDHLAAENAHAKKQEKELQQKREYLTKRLTSQQTNLQELIRSPT